MTIKVLVRYRTPREHPLYPTTDFDNWVLGVPHIKLVNVEVETLAKNLNNPLKVRYGYPFDDRKHQLFGVEVASRNEVMMLKLGQNDFEVIGFQ